MNSLSGHICKFCFTVFIAVVSSGLVTSTVLAKGNVMVGKIKASGCTRCHGAKGVSSNSKYPNLAGQHENYLIQTLKEYKSGYRKSQVMKTATNWLTDTNIKDLAAYYSSIKIVIK